MNRESLQNREKYNEEKKEFHKKEKIINTEE